MINGGAKEWLLIAGGASVFGIGVDRFIEANGRTSASRDYQIRNVGLIAIGLVSLGIGTHSYFRR